MSTELSGYLLLLSIGTTLTLLVGVILRRSGQALLEEVYEAPRAARITGLVSVGFNLFSLGVLALISTVPVPVDGQVQTLVTKLGVVLLVLGAAYGLALRTLGGLREQRHQAELDQEFSAAMRART
ncbi:MAG TPA: hypothetical protein VGH89_25765 [Pseudonocardia sp.]|jgi:hypothetical protein